MTAATRKPPRRPQGLQALHIVAERVGASDEVINNIPDNWKPKPGLPRGGRDECRDGPRPCPYLQCKHHLWPRSGDDRAGRPGEDRKPATVLEMRTMTTCELDVSTSPRTAAEIGRLFNISKRRVQQIIKRALHKLGINEKAQHLAPDDKQRTL